MTAEEEAMGADEVGAVEVAEEVVEEAHEIEWNTDGTCGWTGRAALRGRTAINDTLIRK